MEASVFRPVLTDAGGGRTFSMLGSTMRLIATAAETGRGYTVLEQITPPGWGPPRHIHSREDEIFYILEGSYDLHVGRRTSDRFRWRLCDLTAERSTRLSQRVDDVQPFTLCHCSWRIRGILPGRRELFAASQSSAVGRDGATVWLDPAAAGSLNAESKSLRLR